MYRDKEKETRSFMQAKLNDLAHKVTTGMNRPVYKFVRDMLFAFSGDKKTSVHNAAKFIVNNTTTKKTSERLYRNLGRIGLDERLREALIDLVSPHIKDDSLIIVDESDIEKEYAKQMEGLAMVHNGSKGTQTKGYVLLNILACIEGKHGYNLLPFSGDLYSHKLELDSLKQIMLDRLVEINIKCNGRGIFVFDRGYDDRKLIASLRAYGMSFVIRGTGTRNIVENGCEINFQQAVDKMKFIYQVEGLKQGETFRCATRKITIRTDDHPSKHSEETELNVVVVRPYREEQRRGGEFYLLCDFNDDSLSELEIINKAINVYRNRWKIEEVHRQMKKDFGWEKMRLASYTKLKNLNMLLLIALYFIYKCKDNIIKLAKAFPKIICFDKKDWTRLNKFIYYRLYQAVSLCFNQIFFYDTSPYRYDKIEPLQMKVRLN